MFKLTKRTSTIRYLPNTTNNTRRMFTTWQGS